MIKRGDILLVDLDPIKGSEQGKIRPCLVVQNDHLNQYNSTTIILPITSTIRDKKYPNIVIVNPEESGLKNQSTILCHQIRAVSFEHRTIKPIGKLSENKLREVNQSLISTLGLM